MASSGQDDNPYDQKSSYGEADYDVSQGDPTGYDYAGHTQTSGQYYTSSDVNLQSHQLNQGFTHHSPQEGQQQYYQESPSWPQPVYGDFAAYGSDQAGLSSGTSFQTPSAPLAGGYADGSSSELYSTVQYMRPDTRWASHGVATTTQHGLGDSYRSSRPDLFTTGSVLPGQDELPRQDWYDNEGFNYSTEMDRDDDDDSMPNYSAPVDKRNLPAPVSIDKQAEAMTATAAMKKRIDKDAKEAARKLAQQQSLDKYRKQKAWDELYVKEKERITRGINKQSKQILNDLLAEKQHLLQRLKKHDHTKCTCDAVHQYLFFTGESRHITREEAFKLGWLTKEELDALECRSPQHSPGKGSSSSGNSGSSYHVHQDQSPSENRSGKDKSGKGKGKDDRGKDHKKGGKMGRKC